MPLELTQSRVQKIWVPVDHRPSLPRCECSCVGARLSRVQSSAIVCRRFVTVPVCWKRARAGRPGGARVAAGCTFRPGRQGRCSPGNGECTRPPLLSQRLRKACASERLGSLARAPRRRHPQPTAAGARPCAPPPLSADLLSAFLPRCTFLYLHLFSLPLAMCLSPLFTVYFLPSTFLSSLFYPHLCSLSLSAPDSRRPSCFSLSL
jgi:hypothetical protein